jgi:hypothetical protein
MPSASLECDNGDDVAKYREAQYVIWPTIMKMKSIRFYYPDTICPATNRFPRLHSMCPSQMVECRSITSSS